MGGFVYGKCVVRVEYGDIFNMVYCGKSNVEMLLCGIYYDYGSNDVWNGNVWDNKDG
jgi:hypothetical protein